MKRLTISVAAYNVAQYLPKLISSIINSKNRDYIELIIVNDGSTDSTNNVVNEYIKKFPSIISLVDKENGGHGSTINTGIKHATGKYFRALDGDDWLYTSALEQLVDRIQDIDDDLILTNYLQCIEGKEPKAIGFAGLVNNKSYKFDEIAPIVNWMRYHTVIYKTSILQEHDIRLDEHCFYVDAEFMILPMQFVNSVRYINISLYCYRIGRTGQSVSPESRIKHFYDSLTVVNRLMASNKKLPASISAVKRRYITDGIGGHCIWHFRTIMTMKPTFTNRKQLIEFDKRIQTESKDVYEGMLHFGSQSSLIKVMRCSKYHLYFLIGYYKQLRSKMGK